MENKFKVGDIVRGASTSIYKFARKEITRGLVKDVETNGDVIIEILEPIECRMGSCLLIDPKHLELVST